MAQVRDLILEIARDSSSPRTYRATVTYDVAFEPSERRVRARFRDTFLLRDADDGTDRDDLFGSVRGSFVADRAVVQRRLTIRGLTDDTIRRRSGEDDIEAMATVQLRSLAVSGDPGPPAPSWHREACRLDRVPGASTWSVVTEARPAGPPAVRGEREPCSRGPGADDP